MTIGDSGYRHGFGTAGCQMSFARSDIRQAEGRGHHVFRRRR